MRDRVVAVALRVFQVAAIAEGGLLPAILATAVVHWLSGQGATLVAVVGAAHGAAFTAYVLLVPLVAWLLRWPLRTASVAVSVAFVPFAPWVFERRVRAEFARHLGDRLVVAAVHPPGTHVTAAGPGRPAPERPYLS